MKDTTRRMTSDGGTAELQEGARNLVKYAGIEADQEVLIHAEPASDDAVVEAVRSAAAATGANVSVLRTPHWDKKEEPPPPIFEQALKGIDVLIGEGEYLQTKNPYLQRAIFEDGLIYINGEAETREALSSLYGRFPSEVLFAIGTRIMGTVGEGETVRVTTDAGTDVEMRVRPETVGGYCYPFRHDSPGHKKGVPGGTACFHPEDPVNGTIAVQAFSSSAGAPHDVLEEPLFLTIEDHRIVETNGELSEWLDRKLAEHDENAGWLAECMWGIHPKASATLGGRGASNPHLLHFGFGNSIPYGGPVYSDSWTVGFVEDATLTVDGTPVLDDGRLTVLDDPEVRAVAAEHGDPDELLEQVPSTLEETFGTGDR